jgi:triosephosphate isomerase (TIM)
VRPLVAGNWKMHLDHVEAIHLTGQLGVLVRAANVGGVDLLVLPPFVDLRSVTSVVEADRLPILVGAQHVSSREPGAYTGEVSAGMLTRLGVGFVLVGHSERRRLFGMDDEAVAATLAVAQRAELTPILCVGEPEGVRDTGDHERFVTDQLASALVGAAARALVVAYEPVWAIGTGATPTTAEIAEMTSVIKAALPTWARATTRVLYGGSVSADNAATLARGAAIDGFLVGGASLRAEEFVAIAAATADCYAASR